MAFALEVVYLIRVLHVRPELTGVLLAAGSIGGVIGGVLAGPFTRRIGSARIIWVSILGFGVLGLLMPLAEPGWRVLLVPAGMFGFTFSGVLYNIAQLSFRQAICPPELLGRLNAAIRWVVWGTLPLGGLIGGAVGQGLGVRTTVWIGVTGSWLAGLWVYFSPLRTMRDIPAAPGTGGGDGATSAAGPPAAGLPELT